MKSKLDFTIDKLRLVVLELANLKGYEKPSTYLDELLNEVRQLNSFEFEKDFFLNVHYICKENAAKFWSEGHRQDISDWLMKARFGPTIMKPDVSVNLFSTTWENTPLQPNQPAEEKMEPEISLPQLALFLHYNGETVTRNNGNDIAKQYGHNSGEKLFQLFTKFHSRQNRIGKEATRKKNLNKLALYESVIPKLSAEAKQKATDEMNTFKAAFERES